MPIKLNDLETARFGVITAHVVDPDAPIELINAAASAKDVDMVIARVDVGQPGRVHMLEADGYRLMDSLVYYSRPLEDVAFSTPLPKGVTIRLATPGDAPEVADVARAAFQNYIGHYHADPRLDRAMADEAYVQWAEHSITNLSDTAPAIVAEDDGKIVGFLTLRRNSAEEVEIVLNAIAPSAQRGGIYRNLLTRSIMEGRSLARHRIIVSTQVNNFAVQRVWVRHGFTLYRGLYTFHKWYDKSADRKE